MLHLSRPITIQERFECRQTDCKCKLPPSPKKDKSNKDDAIPTTWQDIDETLFEPPINFGTVDKHLYRSSFPQPANYRFLNSLNLKTILCLVEDEPLPAQYIDWIERSGIDLIQIGMPGHKEAFRDGIPYDLIGEALRLVVNHANYPMLVHCNRGKHRTGTVIACLRKLQAWHTTRALDEYARYSHPKERTTDQAFIETFRVEELRVVVGASPSAVGGSPFTSMLNLPAKA